MFSFSIFFELPLEIYRELLQIEKRRWSLTISKTSTLFRFDASLKPFRDSYSNTIFFVSIGLFTFDINFSIFDWTSR
jgi:hypothetical protein